MRNTGIIVKVLMLAQRISIIINVSTSYCEHRGCALCMRVRQYVCVYGLLPD